MKGKELVSEDFIEIEEEFVLDNDDKEDKDHETNNKKGTKLHTIKSEIKIINYAKINTQKEASIKYNVPITTINTWMKKEKEFSNVSTDKLNKTTLHCGRQILYPEDEKEIVKYIEFNRNYQI